ncbi:hypothetical protein EYF80_008573 [Liparis tanakae]|uniref:Uncharacterized protein n=1 Tax=Liparis tanakae TaxID=230148 RepID=A0A4Z2ITA6_9TELE|nr:hypothetical protein EYF80_008573 [Liparis tanakae]
MPDRWSSTSVWGSDSVWGNRIHILTGSSAQKAGAVWSCRGPTAAASCSWATAPHHTLTLRHNALLHADVFQRAITLYYRLACRSQPQQPTHSLVMPVQSPGEQPARPTPEASTPPPSLQPQLRSPTSFKSQRRSHAVHARAERWKEVTKLAPPQSDSNEPGRWAKHMENLTKWFCVCARTAIMENGIKFSYKICGFTSNFPQQTKTFHLRTPDTPPALF